MATRWRTCRLPPLNTCYTAQPDLSLTAFEYVIPLVSVVVGIAIADIAGSLHLLLQNRERITWDWLPLATAFLSLLILLFSWWSFYNLDYGETALFTSIVGFAGVCLVLIAIYLLAAASLPSSVPETGLDLREFYLSNAGYFWTLAVVVNVVVAVMGTIRIVLTGGGVGDQSWVPILVTTVVFVVLARTKQRRVHVAVVGLLGALLLVGLSTQVLGAV